MCTRPATSSRSSRVRHCTWRSPQKSPSKCPAPLASGRRWSSCCACQIAAIRHRAVSETYILPACNDKTEDPNERTTAEVAGNGGVVGAAVERTGERRRAGGGLNYRLLEPRSALVDAGTTFVCQGDTASERRCPCQVPHHTRSRGGPAQWAANPQISSRFTALHCYGAIFAAAASLLPLPARDGQRTDSREHHPTVGSLLGR